MKEYELKKGKILTEDNFRSKVVPSPRYNLELSLKNEIKTENTNLITYLNKSNGREMSVVQHSSLLILFYLQKRRSRKLFFFGSSILVHRCGRFAARSIAQRISLM